MTVTVPRIELWILQWYANVPALANVNVYESPDPKVPLSKSAWSEVTVWVTPVFVHVTVVPTLTLIAVGLKPKSTTVTALPDAAPAGEGAALAPDPYRPPLYLPEEAALAAGLGTLATALGLAMGAAAEAAGGATEAGAAVAAAPLQPANSREAPTTAASRAGRAAMRIDVATRSSSGEPWPGFPGWVR